MKLLIDANILIDVLQNREPYAGSSSIIWKLCETGQVKGYVTVLTFANIVYILRKEMRPEFVKHILHSLSLIFEFVDFSVFDLFRAAEYQWDDFEDAVQSVAAERLHADCIITRNVKDFTKSKVPAVTPEEVIAQIKKTAVNHPHIIDKSHRYCLRKEAAD